MNRANTNRKARRMTGPLTRQAVKSMIKSSINSTEEAKVVQVGASGNTSVSGAIVGLTSPIVQGTDTGQRTGLKVVLKKMSVYFQATINASATSDRVRFIVFADTENQNALPNVTDVLASASVASFLNIANEQSNRFKILCDKVIQLNTAGSAGSYVKIDIPVRNWPVHYAGNTGYGRNNVFLLEISDTPTNLATFAMTSETRYTDA